MLTTRRRLLRTTAALGGFVALTPLLDACAPASPAPSPTAPPAKPAEAPKPAATTPPAAQPATPKPAEAAKPAEAKPTEAAKPAAKTDRTFKFAYLTLGWAGTEVIHKQDMLKERGWNIEWQLVGPISGLVNAFASGQADIIDMSAVIAAQMHEGGVKLKIFGAGVGTLGSIVAPKDSPIKSAAELKGKKVGGIPGGTTTQDINASIRKIYGFDVFQDTQFVQAGAPPDAANLLTKGEVDAILIWEPTTTQLVIGGQNRVVATQQELWEQASGSKQTQVHVIYLTTPEIAQSFRPLLADINEAQKQVAELWPKKDPKAVEAIMSVTQLPKEVVEAALDKTKPLYGLSDEIIDTMLAQLKFNREHGSILKSDVWNDPAKLKDELFVRV
jgi:ABC-type nitrate/sulfonate/bicarbonate transport system substrate-binding protein